MTKDTIVYVPSTKKYYKCIEGHRNHGTYEQIFSDECKNSKGKLVYLADEQVEKQKVLSIEVSAYFIHRIHVVEEFFINNHYGGYPVNLTDVYSHKYNVTWSEFDIVKLYNGTHKVYAYIRVEQADKILLPRYINSIVYTIPSIRLHFTKILKVDSTTIEKNRILLEDLRKQENKRMMKNAIIQKIR